MYSSEYEIDGFEVLEDVVPKTCLEDFYGEVRTVGSALLGKEIEEGTNVDEIWRQLASIDRNLAGKLYDAVKYSTALRSLASDNRLTDAVRKKTNFLNLALVDLNVRIDAPEEDRYLFDWHQDFWFSICSPEAVVVWIPLTDLNDRTGGIHLISNRFTGGKIFKVRRNPQYNSYSNSILLDEEIPCDKSVPMIPGPGSAAIFKFNCLHKSMRNRDPLKCRWTMQLRFVSYGDPYFASEGFRPGVVTADRISYLERIEKNETN
jgi:hypothetical protein